MAIETEEMRLVREIEWLEDSLASARELLLQERFRNVPRLAVGDLVTVPRTLFGKLRQWPARIETVHLHYSSGVDASGKDWVTTLVSYHVKYRRPDGTYGDDDHGFWAKDVTPIGE